MRSWPMYSSSMRGRSPASYCASSSTRAAVTTREFVMMLAPSFRQLAQGLLQRLLEPAAGGALERGVHRLFSERPMISQVHQRREEILAQGRGAGRAVRYDGRHLSPWETILQLEDYALRSLLSDTGNRRQPRDVAALDGADELERFDARQDGERDLRSDAADANQPLEQLLLERRREAVQRERVLTDVGPNPQRNLMTWLAEPVKRRQGNEDLVPDAVDVHH